MQVKNQFEKIEEGLARARAAIREAGRSKRYTSHKKEGFVPRGSVYTNPYSFHQLRSYLSPYFTSSVIRLSLVLTVVCYIYSRVLSQIITAHYLLLLQKGSIFSFVLISRWFLLKKKKGKKKKGGEWNYEMKLLIATD